jgi:kynurenine formamidase
MVNQTHEEYEEYKERWHCDFGFEAHNWLLSEHTGTHTDAIFEYAANGPTLDDIRLEYYYGSATCLDVSSVRHPEYITEKAPSPCHCVAALHN